MKKTTTSASTPARRKAPAAKSAPTEKVIVHVGPTDARFFFSGAEDLPPYSVLGNGPAGSDAAAILAGRIETLRREGISVVVKQIGSPE